MKHFFFRLEPVLSYRKLLEDGEERKLKVIQAAILEAERLKEELGVKIGDSRNSLQERSRGTIDIEKVRSLVAYIERLGDELIQASYAISKLEQDRTVQRAKLLEARRSREVVEKLKQNSLDTYEKESRAMEQKVLDELSVTQFGRRAGQELPEVKPDA